MTGRCVIPACGRLTDDDRQLCRVCASRTAGWLAEIPGLYGQLTTPADEEPPKDPVTARLPAGPVPGLIRAPRVSGTLERGVPARIDLLAPADTRTVTDPRRDQIGDPSVATILRGWVVAWWEDGIRDRGENLPPSRTVTTSARWLADRLDWASEHHPGIAAFAEEIRTVHHMLLRANGLTMPRPELVDGVPCKWCDHLCSLLRPAGSEWVECRNCGQLYSHDELQAWIKLLAAAVCGLRHIDDGVMWLCGLEKHHDGDCTPPQVSAPLAEDRRYV